MKVTLPIKCVFRVDGAMTTRVIDVEVECYDPSKDFWEERRRVLSEVNRLAKEVLGIQQVLHITWLVTPECFKGMFTSRERQAPIKQIN